MFLPTKTKATTSIVEVTGLFRTYVHVRYRDVRPSQRGVDASKPAARPDFYHPTPHEVVLRKHLPAVHVAAAYEGVGGWGGGLYSLAACRAWP